jgi:hypothetical protein
LHPCSGQKGSWKLLAVCFIVAHAWLLLFSSEDERACSPEMSVHFPRTRRDCISQDLHSYCCQDLKSSSVSIPYNFIVRFLISQHQPNFKQQKFTTVMLSLRPPLWSTGQSSWLQVPGLIPGASRFSEK